MSAPQCSWGGSPEKGGCGRGAVASIGWLSSHSSKPMGFRPYCEEHVAFYAADPGYRAAEQRHSDDPAFLVVDYRQPTEAGR